MSPNTPLKDCSLFATDFNVKWEKSDELLSQNSTIHLVYIFLGAISYNELQIKSALLVSI